MKHMRSLDPELLALARTRHGVLSAADLRSRGLDASRVFRAERSHLLTRVAVQTYAIPSMVDPFTVAAAIQLRHPRLILERRTAAAVWGLDGLRPPPGSVAPLPLDLVHTDRVRTRTTRFASRRAPIPDDEITTHDGFRLTSVPWTLSDLGAVVDITVDLLELALESALRLGLTTDAALRTFVAARGAARSLLHAALVRRRPDVVPTESYAETRFLQTVVRPLALEDPERQVRISVAGRPEPYRADFLFQRPFGCLDVEIDGAAWHGPGSARADAMRDHYLRLAGVQTLHLEADRVDRKPHGAQAALKRELALLEAGRPA
jgi:very-short-patch-repair endonuclease